MEVETRALVGAMIGAVLTDRPGYDLWEGDLYGRRCIVARCGMGKVSAAATTQHLVGERNVDPVIVCGMAGGLHPELRLGDVVVGSAYVQHDVDASPIFPRYEVPGLDIDRFIAPRMLVEAGVAAVQAFIDAGLPGIGMEERRAFGIDKPVVRSGLIATGDQFITETRREALREALPNAMCAEMEGAAIAQVCYMNSGSFLALRIISDNADASAAVDFKRFADDIAPHYTLGIVRELLSRI
jgi:adenosylhomocysteine nucleosidase